MQTFLYIVWFLIPVGFFFLGLWSLMEKLGGSPKKQVPSDYFIPGVFTLVIAFVALIVDQYFLQGIAEGALAGALPLEFLQIVLWPLLLAFGAMLLGPSKEIMIGKKSGAGRSAKHGAGKGNP